MPKKVTVKASDPIESKEEKIESVKETKSTTSSPPSSYSKVEGQKLNGSDFSYLYENEHYRYVKNSKKIGHALIVKNAEGDEIAIQYDLPQGTGKVIPEIRPLENIEAITPLKGMHRFTATTPTNKTRMHAKRFIDVEVGNKEDGHLEKAKIALFSPKGEGPREFWPGGDYQTPLYRSDLTEIKETNPIIKGGRELAIDPESVKERDIHNTRKPDQNTVMDKVSAKEAYENFLKKMMDKLSPEMKERLKAAIDAPFQVAFKDNPRPEWLHAEGFWATPLSENPQRKDNLGAAPKWANTEMMVLERIAKWFALNQPHTFVKIKPEFEMLLDSELIKKINFKVTIEDKKQFINLLQSIDPFQKFPAYRKASDIAVGAEVVASLLQNIPPLSKQKVLDTGKAPSSFSSGAISSSKPLADIETKLSSSSPPSKKTKKAKPASGTPLNYEKNIVEIFTTSQDPDYNEPSAKSTHVSASSGTGFVISQDGKKYILTNAHCVENSTKIRIRLTNDRTKRFEATRKCVSYQCDLALLEVKDPEFLASVEPVELGEMARARDVVYTVGFPMGGSEISTTKGIVSRVEVRPYAMSDLNMLQVQVDAAINHGNSGGPVYSKGKVIGVAFQGNSAGENLGYIIPIPIINHFIKEALNKEKYCGFPVLPITIQTLQNKFLRKSYGMTSEQTGVLITDVDKGCDAHAKLKPDDILLEIDSMPISNEGTVDISNIGKCLEFVHVTHMKYIGDTVNLKVLRKNEETKEPTVLTIPVMLDSVPHQREIIPATEHDKMPTFYIAGGISFIPLTRNYLDEDGGELEDLFFVEQGCKLTDLSKDNPDAQLVVINEILDCEETEGYDNYKNTIVKEVNGKQINNIKDVVAAIEANKEETHTIIIADKRRIVVKNMSKKEHDDLLSMYNRHSDRSDDLKLGYVPKLPLASKEEPSPSLSSTPKRSALSSVPTKPALVPPKRRLRRIEEEEDVSQEESKQVATELKPGRSPGLKHFFESIDRIAENYSKLPKDKKVVFMNDEDYEEENDSDYASSNDEASEAEEESETELQATDRKAIESEEENESGHESSNDETEEDEEEENESKEERKAEKRSVARHANRNSLFAVAHSRNKELAEHEEVRESKRTHRKM